MENEIEIIDSTNDEGVNLEETSNEPVQTETESYEMMVEQNKKLYARAKKAEEEAKKLKTQTAKSQIESKEINNSSASTDNEWKERMELIARGYQDDTELDFIMKNGGKKSLEDPFVKAAIKTQREQKKAEDAQVANTSAKSAIERKYSPEQIKAMSAEEMEPLLPR